MGKKLIKNVTHRLFNVGSGVGKSINDVIDCIRKTLDIEITVQYEEGRKSDVPINYLDISLYEKTYGKLNQTPMQTGIIKTKDFLLSTRSVDEKNKLC